MANLVASSVKRARLPSPRLEGGGELEVGDGGGDRTRDPTLFLSLPRPFPLCVIGKLGYETLKTWHLGAPNGICMSPSTSVVPGR